MTVHFFYNYKEDLVNKLKEHYAKEIKQKEEDLKDELQLDEAEKLIRSYFSTIKKEINELISVSDGEIGYEEEGSCIAKFTINKNYIKFTRAVKTIEVKIGKYIEEDDMVESTVLANIVNGDKKCKIKKRGKVHDGSNFDENTINYYMREAFGPLDI